MLSKQDDRGHDPALGQFTLLLARIEANFAEICGPRDAPKLARQMLLRMQGASVLASAFHDETWLFEVQRAIAEWLEGLAATAGKHHAETASDAP